PPSPAAMPRILFVDDNVRSVGGHYLELASLLADGARQLGFQPSLIANRGLANECGHDDSRWNPTQSKLAFPIFPEFSVRRMEHWSLGVDGNSSCRRAAEKTTPEGVSPRAMFQRLRDAVAKKSRQPERMISVWANTFHSAVVRFDPGPDDAVVVNTGSDFQMLALARALKQEPFASRSPKLRIHVLFHFAIYDQTVGRRAQEFGFQVNQCLQQMKGHDVTIHATTAALTDQLVRVGVSARAVPYPTRERPCVGSKFIADGTDRDDRPKIVLAGIPRVEKGRDLIRNLIAGLDERFLRPGRLQWSMQLPQKRWQRYLPKSSLDLCDDRERLPAIERQFGNLSDEAYHRWIDSASIGLFLYDPRRYVARCSGVLLEMMVRGIPVIVPEGCWLSEQVRSAPRPIGWIYRDARELPDRLETMLEDLPEYRQNALEHARYIREHHCGAATLYAMNFQPVMKSKQAA
ncbi:MAG: hypothetical protein AAFV88_25475, partial [Planctomycetota bacterium]